MELAAKILFTRHPNRSGNTSFSAWMAKLVIRGVLAVFMVGCGFGPVWAEMTITVQGPESKTDLRRIYGREIMELALERTVADYGAYHLVETPVGANSKRSLRDAAARKYENYFVKYSVSREAVERYGYVPFPVDLGIVGYRVAFLSENTKNRLQRVQTVEDLKTFSVVQGIGWLDTKILRAQGFNVATAGSYESMFHMVARDRYDLFLRGANEILDEWVSHKHIEGLRYDQSIIIYYPLPRFFFTAVENKDAIQRVGEGLLRAYEDGALVAAWEKLYRPSLEFVNFNARKVFRFKNPEIEGLDIPYERFLFKPD